MPVNGLFNSWAMPLIMILHAQGLFLALAFLGNILKHLHQVSALGMRKRDAQGGFAPGSHSHLNQLLDGYIFPERLRSFLPPRAIRADFLATVDCSVAERSGRGRLLFIEAREFEAGPVYRRDAVVGINTEDRQRERIEQFSIGVRTLFGFGARMEHAHQVSRDR